MKKLLFLCVALPFITLSVLLYVRLSSNPTSLVPYPFVFNFKYSPAKIINAPILIIGDGLGQRLGDFADNLSNKISANLLKPIRIQTYAKDGESIHRTFHKIKSLKRIPLIIIYLGSRDDRLENIFTSSDILTVFNNFKLYENPYLKTAMMIYPPLSKLIYTPIKYVTLSNKINKDKIQLTSGEHMQRSSLHFKLYESALADLFRYITNASSIIIPITTPINLKTPPHQSCYGSIDDESLTSLEEIKKLVKIGDYKGAYSLGHNLTLLNPYNAEVNFVHGEILEKLNRWKEAIQYKELSVVYDCKNLKSSPVYNSILRKTAKKMNISFFDFHKYLADQTSGHITFSDNEYPHDFYYDKLNDMLAARIKKQLKL